MCGSLNRPPNLPAHENTRSLSSYSKNFKFSSLSSWPPSLLSLPLLFSSLSSLSLTFSSSSGAASFSFSSGGGLGGGGQPGAAGSQRLAGAVGSQRRQVGAAGSATGSGVRVAASSAAAGDRERWVTGGGGCPPPPRIRRWWQWADGRVATDPATALATATT
uniref:Uncharacterized protein n=1 Tax=Oryza barthii TaxID=65489 RepID=A0A679B9T3_9ORYZ|nr:hypothetical protein [Oryza barthii]BBF89260.1 hypothetical protein [Oryza barthii]